MGIRRLRYFANAISLLAGIAQRGGVKPPHALSFDADFTDLLGKHHNDNKNQVQFARSATVFFLDARCTM